MAAFFIITKHQHGKSDRSRGIEHCFVFFFISYSAVLSFGIWQRCCWLSAEMKSARKEKKRSASTSQAMKSRRPPPQNTRREHPQRVHGCGANALLFFLSSLFVDFAHDAENGNES